MNDVFEKFLALRNIDFLKERHIESINIWMKYIEFRRAYFD